MPALNDNPFAVLTAVVAPAILTNACSVLSLGTANRIARVVDRTRVVISARAASAPGSAECTAYSWQLDRLQQRGQLLIRALRLFYAALGSFATSALIAVVGSALVAYDLPIAFRAAAAAGLTIGSAGVICLAAGCGMMVQETRIALRIMTEEINMAAPGSHIGETTPPIL